MAGDGMILELNQQTVDYIEELMSDLKKVSEDLEADNQALKSSFNSHGEYLGVHSDEFEEWVDNAISSVKDNGENTLDSVNTSLRTLQGRISDYL